MSAEVYEVADTFFSGAEIVDQLGLVLGKECFHGFDLHHDFSDNDEIRFVAFPQGLSFVEKLKLWWEMNGMLRSVSSSSKLS